MKNNYNKNNIIFGRHPVVDAIRSGSDVDKVFIQRGTSGDFEKEMRNRMEIQLHDQGPEEEEALIQKEKDKQRKQKKTVREELLGCLL